MESIDITSDLLRSKDLMVIKVGRTIEVHKKSDNTLLAKSDVYYEWNKTERTIKKKLKEETTLNTVTIQEILSCISGNFESLLELGGSSSSSSTSGAAAGATTREAIALTEDLTKEVTKDEINAILSTSIKMDYDTKFIALCNNLLAQTKDDQMNISYQADSSAGKSYIPLEVATYFPMEEVIEIASASPAAFFHERGKWNNEKKAQVVDLEGKIIIFLDQQHFKLQERMRSILSHDKKELLSMITDKSDRQGLRTKKVIIRGFASFHFCTTRIDPDEQERTRMLQLSPSTDPQKILESLRLISLRKGNPEEYAKQILQDPRRLWLTNRIIAIRQSGIREIIIPDNAKSVRERFIKEHPHLIGRHQRDFPRLLGLIKAHALLNCFTREKKSHDTIIATQADIDAGFALYNQIGESNEIGVSPYLYDIYKDVISPLFESNKTLTREDILRKYYQVRHKPLDPQFLRSNVLPQLEAVGLIIQDPDPDDKRRMLVCKPDRGQNNVVIDTGVKSSIEQNSAPINNEKSYPPVSNYISDVLVDEEEFRTALISSGKFTAGEATQAINEAVAAGELVRGPEWGKLKRRPDKKEQSDVV